MAALAAALLVPLGGCGGDAARDGGGRGGDDADTARAAAEARRALRAEVRTAVLPPSDVRTQPVGASGVAQGAAASQVTTSAAGTSTVSVQQILSDFQARRTAEGIVIDLPENVLFDFDKAEVRPDARDALGKISRVLAAYPQAPVRINGHTDGRGGDQYNLDLSARRAGAVRDFLVQQYGVPVPRLQAGGFGKGRPVAPNLNPDGSDNPEGRQKNRRVEVVIQTR